MTDDPAGVCLVCGAELSHKQKKYCSDRCKWRWHAYNRDQITLPPWYFEPTNNDSFYESYVIPSRRKRGQQTEP